MSIPLEGAGKGDALRERVDWKRYGKNYDAIFRKRPLMRFESEVLDSRGRFKKNLGETIEKAHRQPPGGDGGQQGNHE